MDFDVFTRRTRDDRAHARTVHVRDFGGDGRGFRDTVRDAFADAAEAVRWVPATLRMRAGNGMRDARSRMRAWCDDAFSSAAREERALMHRARLRAAAEARRNAGLSASETARAVFEAPPAMSAAAPPPQSRQALRRSVRQAANREGRSPALPPFRSPRVNAGLSLAAGVLAAVVLSVGGSAALMGVSAATWQGPSANPPLNNLPSPLWNAKDSGAIQSDAAIAVDGGTVAGGENLIYGNADGASTGSLMLLQTASSDRFRVDADGNVSSAGCFGPAFVGLTTTGSPNNDGKYQPSDLGSYLAAHAACAADYAGSHVCTVNEMLTSIACGGTGAPIRNAAFDGQFGWVHGGPPGFTADANDCKGWSSSAANAYGRFWIFAAGTGGVATATTCNVGDSVALSCCR